MSLFAGLKRDESIEQPKDTLGGGFTVLETDVYPAVVKMAYAGKSRGGAQSVTIEFQLPDERTHKETFYVTSGDAKGNKNYYESNGTRRYLPGFVTVDELCAVATGHLLADQETATKIVKEYDFDAGGEIDKEVPALTDLIGKKVKLAIRKVVEFKRKEIDGKWVDVDETREKNEVDKAFNEDGFTVNELMNKAEEAEFIDAWIEKNQGKVKDLTKGKKASPAGSGTGSPKAAPKKSLFG